MSQAVSAGEAITRARAFTHLRPQSQPAGRYRPRDPSQGVLYQVVADDLEPFLRRLGEQSIDGAGLPAYVERELRSFIECGLPIDELRAAPRRRGPRSPR